MMRTLVLPLLLLLPLLAQATPFAVTATPAQVVLGRDTAVELRVEVPAGTPALRATASVGTLTALPAPAPAVQAWRWVPPDIRYPLLAVVAFWADTPEGPPEVTTVHLPLLGRTNLQVKTARGADVVVRIGEASFGPVRANSRGKAQVPVEVPPGVKEARVLATARGRQTDRAAPLDVPPERPLLALFSPESLTPDSEGWLQVLGGTPAEASQLELKVGGAQAQVVEAARGLFRVKAEPGASEVRVDVRWKDGTGSAHAMAPVQAPVVKAVELVTPPPPVEVRPVPTVEPLPLPSSKDLAVHALAGGFFAGLTNTGPQVDVGASWRLPWLQGRASAEVELGLHVTARDVPVEQLGTLHSRVLGVPLLVAGRFQLFEQGPLSLYGRMGLGTLFFVHEVPSSYQPTVRERGLTPVVGFLAAQGAWNLGKWSALVELRGGYSPARTPQLNVQLGGMSVAVGMRYAL
jgi:hypothetical protein